VNLLVTVAVLPEKRPQENHLWMDGGCLDQTGLLALYTSVVQHACWMDGDVNWSWHRDWYR
jgi:hypothetical protein